MEFDPYRKWLGIPVAEQPPNHYRLLAIGLFEDDSDVIEAAADQRMAHLRTFQAGPHSALSQKLLNELAAAKLCLLDPTSRQAYDEELRRRLSPAPVPVPITAPVVPVRPQPVVPVHAPSERAPSFEFAVEPSPRASRRRARRLNPAVGAWLLLAAVAIPAAIFVGYLVSAKEEQVVAEAQPKESPHAEQNPSPALEEPPQVQEDSPKRDPAPKPAAQPEPPESDEARGGDSGEAKQRNLETPDPAAGTGKVNFEGFVQLFNGNNLAGWKPHPDQSGNWRVEDGVLKGAGPSTSYLVSERGNYANFHLRVEARINDGGDSGVYCRASLGPELFPDGYEAQINASEQGEMTGGLYGRRQAGPLVRVADSSVRAGEWFTLETIVSDNHIVVKVNGQTTADYSDSARRFPMGHIALEKFRRQTEVEFRKIEIRENPPAPEERSSLATRPAKQPDPPKLVQASASNSGGAKRFPCEKLEGASESPWSIDGDKLLQASLRREGNALGFGEADWDDYDFSVEASRVGGNDAFGLLVGRQSDAEYLIYALGGRSNSVCDATEFKSTARVARGERPRALMQDQWYRAEIRIRGENCQCFLDGEKLFEFDSDRKLNGRIGLWTWGASYRFRNIVVKAPDGKILLEGLPDLDRDSAAPAIAAGDNRGKNMRFPIERRGGTGDEWVIEGDELVRRPDLPVGKILFGDPAWTDYDISFKAKVQKGWTAWFYFRYQDEKNFHSYGIGGWENTWELVETREGGAEGKRQCERNVAIPGDVWQPIRISVRGEKGKCFRNDKLVGEFSIPHLSQGRLGFAVEQKASYRFRDIIVKSPAGKILLKGLPDVAEASVPEGSKAGTARPRTPGDLAVDKTANHQKLAATEAFPLQRHEGAVTRLAFHRTQPLLASAGKDGRVLLWNLQTRAPLELHKFGEEVWALKFHPGGDFLAFANRNWWGSRLFFKSLAGLKLNEIKDFKNPGGEVWTIAYSHDGRLLAAGQINGTIRLWDVAQSREILPPVAFGDGHNIYALAFGPATVDRKSKQTQYRLAAGGRDGLVRILTATLDSKSGQWTFQPSDAQFPMGGEVFGLRFSPQGDALGCTHTGGRVSLCDPNTGKLIRNLVGGGGRAEWIAFHPQRPWCVSAHRDPYVARIWNTETAEPLCELKGHIAGVMCAEFSPDGRHVATASEDLSIKLWNLAGADVPAEPGRKKKTKPVPPLVGD